MGFQGVTNDPKLARSGLQEAFEEVIDLSGINGQESQAGMKFLA